MNMKQLSTLAILAMTFLIAAGCKGDKAKPMLEKNMENLDSINTADSTIYGTMADGGMNSLILVTDNGDTLEFLENLDDTAEVVKGGKLVGDRFATISYKQYGDLFIKKAINLTSLMGTWTSLDRNFEIKDGGVIISNLDSEKNPWTSWKIYNGQLILSKDTFDVYELDAETLSLENKEGIFNFTRKRK